MDFLMIRYNQEGNNLIDHRGGLKLRYTSLSHNRKDAYTMSNNSHFLSRSILALFALSQLTMCDGGSGPSYPIDSKVHTTLEETITFPNLSGLAPNELSNIPEYTTYGYGNWSFGEGLAAEQRTDLMPANYTVPATPKLQKFLNFFTISDIHITDEETPAQLIYLQTLAHDAFETSVYSPVMMYTTQVLDAAMQTINALHKEDPIDFGISLGDAANSSQYNELRWYIDVIDGQFITPSSGAHLGGDDIEYQKPFKAAGLDKSIPWYQTLGNHDHFFLGSFPVSGSLKQTFVGDTILAAGDVLVNPLNFHVPEFYMGVLDGSTPYGNIIDAGPVSSFSSPPKVVADANRFSLTSAEWMKEYFNTTSNPVGHGFNMTDAENGFACYSFVPKSDIPIKVIVLDDTQREDDGSPDIHGHGFLDAQRYSWLKKELADGDAAGQLMIITAHIPIGVDGNNTELGWWNNPQNAVTLPNLVKELQSHPNFMMWLSGHRHFNTVKAFVSSDPVAHPENGFWQVETCSLRDFPQQFRTFQIYLNSDYTVSIVTTNVDPAVSEGSPAAKSRYYAVAAQQIVNNPGIFQNPSDLPDPSIRPMPTGSYNAELLKQLSPEMVERLKTLFPAPTDG